jgi:integrase
MSQTQADLHRGTYLDPQRGKLTVAEYADIWQAGLTHLKESTHQRYTGIVITHIKPVWGTWQLSKLTTNDINAWVGALVSDGLKPGSVRQTHRVLSLILESAAQDSRIARNPAKGASLPRTVREEPVYLSASELRAMAKVSEPDDLVILTLAMTGMRFGELAALRVKRFDAVRRRLTVAESVTEVAGKLVFTTPKTHQTRSVPVPASIAARIGTLCADKGPDELVFTSPKGEVLRLRNWRRRVFDPGCRAIGREELSPHDLRHTAASLAIAAGANVKAVQRMLGHASAAMTLDIYAGLFADDLDSVATALDSLLGGTVVAQEDAQGHETMSNEE